MSILLSCCHFLVGFGCNNFCLRCSWVQHSLSTRTCVGERALWNLENCVCVFLSVFVCVCCDNENVSRGRSMNSKLIRRLKNEEKEIKKNAKHIKLNTRPQFLNHAIFIKKNFFYCQPHVKTIAIWVYFLQGHKKKGIEGSLFHGDWSGFFQKIDCVYS